MIGYGKLTPRLTLAPKHRWANWAKVITAMPITTENERMGLNDRLALDNIEWSQIGHLMNFTQRIISMMERDRNVEWG